MSIEQDIFSALNGASITAYPGQAPQNAVLPYVVYRRVSTMPHDTIGGAATIDQARIQLNCYAQNYTAAKTLGASVKTAIVAGFGPRAVRLHESDEMDGENYWNWIDYSVWKKIN